MYYNNDGDKFLLKLGDGEIETSVFISDVDMDNFDMIVGQPVINAKKNNLLCVHEKQR